MNDPDSQQPGPPEHRGAEEVDPDDFAPTPFDSPFVLPVVLLGLTVWFGYDGWLNPDPDMQRWWWFNQGGAVVFLLGGLWSLRRALRERAEARRRDAPPSAP